MKKVIDYIEENKKQVLLAVGIFAAIILLIVIVIWWKNNAERKEKIRQGVSYLESLEKKDVSEINSKVKAIKAEMSLEYVSDNEDAVWVGFEDAVILGDSRAVGFSYYDFLSDEQVLAEKGAVITDVQNYIDQLKALNPGQVFLCFGLNDLQSGYWPDPESYSEQCAQIMETLETALPQCDVYLNSILPTTDAAAASSSKYTEIGDYNTGLEQMCEEKGYHFIDNTLIAQEHMDLYEQDGLHLHRDFYKYWAANMLLEVE